MQRSIQHALLLVLASAIACSIAFASPREPHKKDAKHQVEALEEQWRQAQISGDTAFMEKILADDYLGITMSGQILTKEQQIERTRSRDLVMKDMTLDDVKVKLVGAAAIVTCTARVVGTSDGLSMTGTYRYTRIYQHLANGSWRITNFEATRARPLHESAANKTPQP
jgi:ketosteroid isomerase-like protein